MSLKKRVVALGFAIFFAKGSAQLTLSRFNSIQNSLFSTQHIVHTTTFFAYDVLKRERAEDSAYVGSFPTIIKIYTQLLIGDNDLTNHDDNVLAMLLQSCKHIKTRNSCRMY